MLAQIALVIAVSYAIFVFMSDTVNPLSVVRGPMKRRTWRLARAVALASLVAGVLSILMLNGHDSAARSALATYLVLVGLFVIPSTIEYRKTSLWH